MSIRLKVIVVVVLSALALAFLIYVVSTTVLVKSYLSIENDEVHQNLERAENAIQDLLGGIRVSDDDWSNWDDAYLFAQGKKDAFAHTDLTTLALTNLKINAMVFLDSGGRVIFRKAIDLETGSDISSESIASYISAHDSIAVRAQKDGSFTGIIQLPEGPMLVVSEPILKSDGSGPSAGTLILGKFLSEKALESLRKLTHLSIALYPYDSGSNPSDVTNAKQALRPKEGYTISPLSDDSIAAYKFLYDPDEKPILILKVNTPRPIYADGRASVHLFEIIAIAGISMFGICILLLIEKIVLSRVSLLEREVAHVNQTHDLSFRVKEGAADEMGKLAATINRTFAALMTSETIEKDASDQAKAAQNDLKKRLEEIEIMNKLMTNRELKMVEMKKELDALKHSQESATT